MVPCSWTRTSMLCVGSALIGLAAACGGAQRPTDERPTPTSNLLTTSAPATTATVPVQQQADCIEGSCAELLVEDDPPALLAGGGPAPFRGYADPSIRRDPTSARLWMAYSWPSIHTADDGRQTTRVETHLARSDDDGMTWQAAGSLWAAESVSDPVTGAAGWTDHEVPDLVPVGSGESLRWVAARLDLFVPAGEGLGRRPPSSFRIAVVVADTPDALANTDPVILGSTATDVGWGVDVALAAIDPALSRCTVWNEPALYSERSTLYMALRCLALTGTGTPDVAASSIELFATEPAGDPSSWEWRYEGQFAGHDEAVEVGGDGLTQTSFALGVDGRPLVLLTPDSWDPAARAFVHHGVRVLELEASGPPRLARSSGGALRIRASITASDLDPLGPGSAAYQPGAVPGVVIARRTISPASLVTSIHDSGLRP